MAARRAKRDSTARGVPRAPVTAAALSSAAARLGIEELHPEQKQVIGDGIAGRDVVMVVPTGFGKSACYQIPSMVLPKPVVVVSPLLALMKDQYDKLAKRDIDAVRIDGTVRVRRYR